MPEHKVEMEIRATELTKKRTKKSGVTFKISSDGRKIGEIQIGQGSFGWKSENKKNFKTKNWTAFCNMLNECF